MDDEPRPTDAAEQESASVASDDPDGLRRRREREEAATPPDEGTPGDGAAKTPSDDEDAAKTAARNLLEWAAVIVGAVLIAVVVRTFVFQTFWIPTPSMAPTLVRNDRVLVNKLSYKFHDPRRGDVVVFERPPNEPPGATKDLIKRIVALPGEHLAIYDGKVHIDGRALDEPYTHGKPSLNIGQCGTGKVDGLYTEAGMVVPDGTVFVMGDNRTDSHDGRCFGPIDEDLIVGRAFLIIWPPSKAGGL